MTKKKQATNGKSALVYLVLDKSGSMEPIRDDTIKGCNVFIDETRRADPEARLSLLLFDTRVHKKYNGVSLKDIEPIDKHVYRPGGGTALLDAVGHAVKEIDEMSEKPSKVVVAILTDGQENQSREYTRQAVRDLVSRRESEDNWQFLFLGANVDAFDEAGAIGVAAAGSTLNWTPTSAGTQVLYASVASNVGSYLRGQTRSAANFSQSDYDAALADLENASSTETSTTTK